MAGRPETRADEMFSSGLKTEQTIKRGDTIYIDQRLLRFVAYNSKRLFREIAVCSLDFLEDGNNTPSILGVLLNDFYDIGGIHVLLHHGLVGARKSGFFYHSTGTPHNARYHLRVSGKHIYFGSRNGCTVPLILLIPSPSRCKAVSVAFRMF